MKPLFRYLFALCGTFLFLESIEPAQGGYFTNTGSLNLAQTSSSYSMTLLPNGHVLLVGGNGNSGCVEIYNPSTGNWTLTNSLSTRRDGHTATLLKDGRVLVVGGGNYLSSAEIYDPNLGTWTFTGSMNLGRGSHTATLLPNGQVLVAGGFNNNFITPTNYLSSAELYDPTTGSWTNTSVLNFARRGHGAVLLNNGKVLVMGGAGPGSSFSLATAELYNPETETWTTTGSMITNRAGFIASLLPNGKVLVAGGAAFLWYYRLASAEVFDPNTGNWEQTGSMSTDRLGHASAMLPNGKILVTGGSNGLKTGEIFDHIPGTWSMAGTMPVEYLNHYQLLLSNLKVLITGGNGTSASSLYVEPLFFKLPPPKRISSSMIQFEFTNMPQKSFTVLTSTNPAAPLTNWTSLGSPLELSPGGRYQVTDPRATNSQRFYRIRAN
jgi:WD40 repeat protein